MTGMQKLPDSRQLWSWDLPASQPAGRPAVVLTAADDIKKISYLRDAIGTSVFFGFAG